MSRIGKHYLFTLFSLMLSAFFFMVSRSMPSSAALFPGLMAGLIAIFAVTMAVNAYRESKSMGSVGADAGKGGNVLRVVFFLVLTVLYVLLIPRVGYFIMTPLFMITAYMYLRAIGFFRAVVISLFFSAFIYGLFVRFLNLPIPMGWLEPLLS